MKCKKCNNEIDSKQKFCGYCGTPVSESNKGKKTGIIIGSIFGVIILLIASLGAIYYFLGRGVSEDKIKEQLVGQSINAFDEKILFTEDSIKEIKVYNRYTNFRSSDTVELEVTIENNSTKFLLNTEANFLYNSSEGWKLSSISDTEVMDVETEEGFDNAIKRLISNDKSISSKYKYCLLKDVKDVKAGVSKVFATIEFTNGVYSVYDSVNCMAKYNWSEDTWDISEIQGQLNAESEKKDTVNEDDIKNTVLQYYQCSKAMYTSNNFNIGNNKMSSESFINGNILNSIDIKDYKINETNNTLKIELEASAESNDTIKELKVKGSITIPLDITGNADFARELTIVSAKANGPSSEEIKKSLSTIKNDNYTIDANAAATFTETKRNEDGGITKIINGTININGQQQEVQLLMDLMMDDKDNYIWYMTKVCKKGDKSYIEF